jgi:hypothetical protein
MASIHEILEQVELLPHDWHICGSMSRECLRAIVRIAGSRKIQHSVETGSGKTTLLFSHMSEDHKVFSIDSISGFANNSISVVKDSSLFNAGNVEWIEGPTQRTLPKYEFQHKLQLALIDGPHGYPFPDLEYYYLYPHLDEGALLIVDDIHIATIGHMFDFLKEDEMFRLLEVVDKTAFFERTGAPMFDPYTDGWYEQNYNTSRFPTATASPAARRVIPYRGNIMKRAESVIWGPVRRQIRKIVRKSPQES